MTFRTFKTRVPDRVLEAAKEAGGSVTSIPGEGLCCVRCEYGDACYRVLIDWVFDDAQHRPLCYRDLRPAAARAGHGALPAA
jgi:hypothetical protein